MWFQSHSEKHFCGTSFNMALCIYVPFLENWDRTIHVVYFLFPLNTMLSQILKLFKNLIFIGQNSFIWMFQSFFNQPPVHGFCFPPSLPPFNFIHKCFFISLIISFRWIPRRAITKSNVACFYGSWFGGLASSEHILLLLLC